MESFVAVRSSTSLTALTAGHAPNEFQEYVQSTLQALLEGQSRIEYQLHQLHYSPSNQEALVADNRNTNTSRISDSPTSDRSSPPPTPRHKRAATNTSFRSGTSSIEAGKSSFTTSRFSQMTRPFTPSKSSFGPLTDAIAGKFRKWPTGLVQGWPQTIAMRFQQSESDRETEIVAAIDAMDPKMRGSGLRRSIMASSQHSVNSTGVGSWMLAPTSRQRLLFDVCGVLVLGYDLITVPYFLAWDVPVAGPTDRPPIGEPLFVIQCLIILFWTADIFFTFRTGFVDGGNIVMAPSKVAKRYLKSWFLPEFLLVFIDWTSVFISSATSSSSSSNSRISGILRLPKVVKLSKVARIMRLAGVLRLVKMSSAMARLSDRNLSTGMVLALQCAQLLGLIFYINHVLGCAWYIIATQAPSDTGTSWLRSSLEGPNASMYDESTATFQYLTCLHWSLTQMTPGSMQINAQNTNERLFNICCLMFGLICFSTMISALSANLTQLRMLNQQKAARLNQLVRFLRERHINPSLAYMVKQQAVDRLSTKVPLLQSNVSILSSISVSYQAKIHTSICRPFLEGHPIFLILALADDRISDELFFEGVSFQVKAKQDTLFKPGHFANYTYVITEGHVQYKQTPAVALVADDITHEVDEDVWLSEHALWSKWTHVGTAECGSMCEVMIIDPEKLFAALRSPVFMAYIEHYGLEYHKRLTSNEQDEHEYPSDLPDPKIDNIEVMTSLPKLLLVHVGLITIDWLHEKASVWQLINKKQGNIDIQKLTQEVKLGRTVLVPRPQGEVLRVARVSCVEIVREDGLILAQIGKFSDNGLQPQCTLPGTTVYGWEDQGIAFQRFLWGDLQLTEGDMDMLGVRHEWEFRDSRKYGLRTKFYRTIRETSIRNLIIRDPCDTTSTHVKVSRTEGTISEAVFTWKSTKSRTNGSRLFDHVFTIAGTEEKLLYAWLPRSQFDHLSTSAGDLELRKIMSTLGFDQGKVKAIALAEHIDETESSHSEDHFCEV